MLQTVAHKDTFHIHEQSAALLPLIDRSAVCDTALGPPAALTVRTHYLEVPLMQSGLNVSNVFAADDLVSVRHPWRELTNMI